MSKIVSRGKPLKKLGSSSSPLAVIPVKKEMPLNRRQKRQVKRLVNSGREAKYADTAVLATVTSAGSITALSNPAQGTTDITRVGDLIHVRKLEIRLNAIAADSTNLVRFILFQWHQDSAGLPPTISTAGTGILQYLNPMSPLNYDTLHQKKFTIIKDVTMNLSLNSSAQIKLISNSFGKALGRRKIEFTPSVTTGYDTYWYILLSDSVAVAHPTVGGYLRYLYDDA